MPVTSPRPSSTTKRNRLGKRRAPARHKDPHRARPPGPDVDQAAADSGERRRDDIAHPLVGVGGQEPRVAYRGDQIWWHRVGQAAQLHARAGGELQITAAELLSDPAQPAKARTRGLATRNADPHNGAILSQVRSQHPRAAIGASHARHRTAASVGNRAPLW